ncbi:MAG: hypothetical protein L7W43_20215 [Rubripirellula sp.]|nr:hypothetical protein [Rubripirellula sp.]
MFYLNTPPKYVAILTMIVLGIASQKQATAAPPELINLYFAEQNRSHCDHLVVAILQGTSTSTKSKEGGVVSLFPPGNTGTKNLPKEGQVVSMFPPGKDGSRPDTGGGTGSGDTKSDVIQCEHCGASCTEPCRCNPSGIGLIFGATDDHLGMMQYEEGFSYITYQTSYGMRAVTLISMGPDSNQILAIAKGWKQDDDCHQDHQQRPPVSVDPNPYAEVGVAHNRTLDYLTPDLNLTLLNLRQGDDKVVRKKPGRTTFANITLKRVFQAAPSDELVYRNSCLFMSHIYRIPADQFLLPNEALSGEANIADDGYRYYQDVQKRISAMASVGKAFQQLEETLLLSPDLTAFNRSVDRQVIETLQSRELNDEERSLVLGSLSLAKGTIAYWNAHDDIFDGDIIERGNGKFWADLGGFAAGFTGALVYNNNNGNASDVNPFATGGALGSFASSLCDKDEETSN